MLYARHDMSLEPSPSSPASWATRLFRQYAPVFLDLLYTRRCEGCEGRDTFLEPGRTGAAQWLCEKCLDGLRRIEAPFCNVCGEPYQGAMTETFRCGNCAGLKLHFDFAIAGYKAEGKVRELVHRFKYQRALYLRGVLGCLLEQALTDPRISASSLQWTLVPVPLFHARQREREYNQAWELCRVLSHTSGMPALHALSRLRATTPQASLSRHQRLENLRGAFAARRDVLKKGLLQGRSVLLVDDVLTTGSTTSECARILRREAGVEKVVVITVARG